MFGAEYLPDYGIRRPQGPKDLPEPEIVELFQDFDYCPCPICGQPAVRLRRVERVLHDVGNPDTEKPRDLRFVYSQHRCKPCNHYFHAPFPKWIPEKLYYTQRVVERAIRLVVEDGLPYESAGWRLWESSFVYVPAGTIQNWVEAAGKKSGGSRGSRASRQRALELLRLHRRR